MKQKGETEERKELRLRESEKYKEGSKGDDRQKKRDKKTVRHRKCNQQNVAQCTLRMLLSPQSQSLE